MKKRLLSITLALGLCLSLLPIAAQAEDTVKYNLWVGSTQVTSANAGDILHDGKVRFDPDTATLTLDNANIEVEAGAGDRIRISWKEKSADKPLTIKLIGNNTVTAGNVTSGYSSYGNYSIGIHGLTSVKITGAGALTAAGGDATASSHHSYGIYLYKGTLTVDDGVTLNCSSGIGGITSCGIRVYLNGMINVGKGAAVTGTAGKAPYGDSIGMCCNNGNITFGNDSRITGTGDTANGKSYGIFANSSAALKYNTALEAKGYTCAVKDDLDFTPADGKCTASVNYNGSSSVTYNAADHSTYQYIKVSSAPHTHAYDESTWSVNSEKHWHECIADDCTDLIGSVKDEASHADTDKDHKCDICGKTVTDHKYEWVIDKEATATEKGSKHEECTVCHDRKPSVDIPASGAIQPSYAIIEGANAVWTKNIDQTLTFRANGDFSSFTGVKVDGILVPSDKYKAVSGSTVVTLNADYLGSLSVGKHTLTVVYSDGECSTDFEIKSAANSNADAPTSPNTGDNSNLMLWFALLAVSALSLVGTGALGIRKKVK